MALHQLEEAFQLIGHVSAAQKEKQMQHQLSVGVTAKLIDQSFFAAIARQRVGTKAVLVHVALLDEIGGAGHRHKGG